MKPKRTSIQRRLMRVIMIACAAVLLLTFTAFFVYEFITYRQATRREINTLATIIAANSTAALAFDDVEEANEILQALRSQKQIVSASLYNKKGELFTWYPLSLDRSKIPTTVQEPGYNFRGNFLEGFIPVMQDAELQGYLFLRSDMKYVENRFMLYGITAIGFIAISFLFAFVVSKKLQRSISQPILELARTASIISEKRDFSVRSTINSRDELGTLTQAFNEMLTEIQQQSDEIRQLNLSLEEKVRLRTSELETANEILQQQHDFIQTIIDSSVDLIAVFNKDLEYVIVNKRADEMYQGSRNQLVGRKLLDVFPALKGSAMINNLEKALAGEFVHDESYRSVISDRYFENFYIPLKDFEGQTDRVLVIGHDITNLRVANEKLKLLNEELEKSNNDLEQFAYVASHDLQEPLRKIQIFSELSERNLQHPEILRRYLQKIITSASRMSDLIKAVLNYSRLAKADKQFTMVDLNMIVQNIKSDLELVIEEKKASISSVRLPVIFANPLQIHQLFLNLISNALKFSDKPPEISISCEVLPFEKLREKMLDKTSARYLKIIVRDNGIGFDQQYADQIFAIFQRLHSGEKFAGTGIGLALCKKIIENHNGSIDVQSQPGKGSTFFVYLPILSHPSSAITSAAGHNTSSLPTDRQHK